MSESQVNDSRMIRISAEEKEIFKVVPRVENVTYFGVMIEDFANKFLGARLYSDINDVEIVKETYTKFFDAPSSHLQDLSIMVKMDLMKMKDQISTSEIVKRFGVVYTSFCKLESARISLGSMLKEKDMYSLELLLKILPPEKNYDKDLHFILCKFYKLRPLNC